MRKNPLGSKPFVRDAAPTIGRVEESARHLRLLTETIAAVNSTLDLEEVLALLAREKLEGAVNVRTRAAHEFSAAEIDLLLAIAAQVAFSIEHATLYSQAQRRVHELEALATISEAVSESLYVEESLEAIVKTTMGALSATGAAIVLEDGAIAWPEGRAGAHAVRMPLRWKRRQIGELVCDRDVPFS